MWLQDNGATQASGRVGVRRAPCVRRQTPTVDHLLRDTEDYLARLGPQGAERTWLVEQLAYLGYPAERVGAALALLTSEGRVRRGIGQNGTEVIYGERLERGEVRT